MCATQARAAVRWRGCAVTGVGFASGHVLAVARFHDAARGAPRTLLWHRDARGRWATHGSPDVALGWLSPTSLSVVVPAARLAWAVHLAPTFGTRVLSTIAASLPAALWRRDPVRRVLERAGGRLLGVPAPTLAGRPAGSGYCRIVPRAVWSVDASVAHLDGRHLGPPVLLAPEPRHGELRLPAWAQFAVGDVFLEPEPR